MSAGSMSSQRRNSRVVSIFHRLSVDLGVIGELGPDGAPLPYPPGLSQVSDEQQAFAETPSSAAIIQIADNPVSIWYHTLRVNVEGLVSAMPALALILSSKLLVDWLASKSLPWGDIMGSRCAICMSGVELAVMAMNYNLQGYVRKRILIGKALNSGTHFAPPYSLHSGIPAQVALAALISFAAFNWKPGMWTPLMLTFTFWLSMIAHYPMNVEKIPFRQHVRSSFVTALVTHLGNVGFIFAIVIPTRLLVRSTPTP
jgi:hypothetical protein